VFIKLDIYEFQFQIINRKLEHAAYGFAIDYQNIDHIYSAYPTVVVATVYDVHISNVYIFSQMLFKLFAGTN